MLQINTTTLQEVTRETAANAIVRVLNCSEPTAYELIRTGQIETFSVGRKRFLKPGAIERFIDRGGSRALRVEH